MRIGIDLDGTVMDFHTPFLEYLNRKFHTNYHIDQITDYEWYDCLEGLSEALFYKTLRDFNDEGAWESVHFYPGAVKALKAQNIKGNSLHVVTARTGNGLPAAEKVFNREGIFIHDFCAASGKKGDTKGDVAVKLQLDIHLEDKPKACVHVASKGIPVALIEQRYNRSWNLPCLPISRVRNAEEALRIAASLVRTAKRK